MGGSHPRTAGSLPGSIPAVTLQAMTSGSSARVTPVTAAQAGVNLEQSEPKAMRAALAQEPHGSQILGMTLARVTGTGPFFSKPQVAWLVSVDPYGGAYSVHGPACGTDNFVIDFIDPESGKWLMKSAGRAPGLRPMPALGPKPTALCR
jgi:hypothetical protein